MSRQMVLFIQLKMQNCATKACKPSFAHFVLENAYIQEIERDYNPELLKFLCLETEYYAIYYYATMINFELPDTPLPDNALFCERLYHFLYNLEILNADVFCTTCGRRYAIEDRVFIYPPASDAAYE